MKNSNKEPLFHIVKRDVLPWYKSWGIRAIAIVAALIVCGIITTVTTGLNPLKVYGAFIQGAFGSGRKVWITFHEVISGTHALQRGGCAQARKCTEWRREDALYDCTHAIEERQLFDT